MTMMWTCWTAGNSTVNFRVCCCRACKIVNFTPRPKPKINYNDLKTKNISFDLVLRSTHYLNMNTVQINVDQN